MTPDELHAIEALLSKWVGGGVYIWSYTVSHRQLTLRLQRSGEKDNVHIVCSGCSYMQGRTVWSPARLMLSTHADEPDMQYVLFDEAGGFRAIFTHVTSEMNVAPFHVA